MLLSAHFLVYGVDGIGLKSTHLLGRILEAAAELMFILLLILIAKGKDYYIDGQNTQLIYFLLNFNLGREKGQPNYTLGVDFFGPKNPPPFEIGKTECSVHLYSSPCQRLHGHKGKTSPSLFHEIGSVCVLLLCYLLHLVHL